jgi:hypothetical protein
MERLIKGKVKSEKKKKKKAKILINLIYKVIPNPNEKNLI